MPEGYHFSLTTESVGLSGIVMVCSGTELPELWRKPYRK